MFDYLFEVAEQDASQEIDDTALKAFAWLEIKKKGTHNSMFYSKHCYIVPILCWRNVVFLTKFPI
jgi:hypothetical protein